MKSALRPAVVLPALLAALPLLASAQTTTQDSLLRRGNLLGGRPRASAPRPAAATRRATTTAADPVLLRLLHESVDVGRVPADQMPDLYRRFLEATRDERRQWSDRDWTEASAALTRLNARYEAVRKALPLEDRLTVRSYQGEFHALYGARRVEDRFGK